MRRLFSFIGIALLALLVSGWGSMLAATLCPHAGANQSQAVTEEHSDCHAKTEQAGEHHSGSRSSRSEATHDAKATPVTARRLHGENVAAFTTPSGTCTHCVGQNELPATPASVQELTLQKRDGSRVVEQTATIVSLPVVFTVQFTPTQHAPPGLTNRKHILLSVFLI